MVNTSENVFSTSISLRAWTQMINKWAHKAIIYQVVVSFEKQTRKHYDDRNWGVTILLVSEHFFEG